MGTAGAAGAAAPSGEVAAEAAAPALEALVAEAVAKSAELAALGQRIAAAEASAAPAGALPDPMASIAISNVPVDGIELDRTPMSGISLGVSQGVPAGAKRRLRRRATEEEAEALRARYEDRRNDVVRRVKRAYIEVQYLDEAVAIAEENKGLAEDFLATAEARYATGKGLQQDVFRAQVRLSRMIDILVALREGRAAAATRLNKLLYRPAAQPLPRLPAIAVSEVEVTGESLGERAEVENPGLEERRVRVEQARTRERLAEAGIRPDLNLGVNYRIRESVPMDPVRGVDFWSVSVGMSLPWVYRKEKVDQEVEAGVARREAAGQDLEAMRNELLARVEELVIETMREEEQIALLDTGLLPQAEGALASSRAAYATGQVEFLTLLDNQMNLYNLELQRVRLMADHERDLAELEYAVGGPVEGRPGPEAGGSEESSNGS